jgi:hypothetical protein
VHAIFAIPLHAHTAPISSTSQVLCVIIIVTLQLLWLFSHAFSITGCYAEIPQPLWQLRLFVFSVTVELTFSVNHPMCLRVLWLEPSVVSGSYTMSCYSSPPISFRFICVHWMNFINLAFKSGFGISAFLCPSVFDTSSRDLRNLDTELFYTSSFPNVTMVITKRLCKKRFSRIRVSWIWRCGISTFQVAIPDTPQWRGINGPDQSLIQRLRLNRNFAYREIDILVALFTCLSMLRSPKLRYGVRSTVQI